MKKEYTAPQLECKEYEFENLITASAPDVISAGTIGSTGSTVGSEDTLDLSSGDSWNVLDIW
ncbi:MAG: hypothetical protein ACI4CT_08440 [Lachnospiraceae bacterium]